MLPAAIGAEEMSRRAETVKNRGAPFTECEHRFRQRVCDRAAFRDEAGKRSGPRPPAGALHWPNTAVVLNTRCGA
jgi:hypothetical protein